MLSNIKYNPTPPGGGILCTLSDSYNSVLYPHFHLEYELSLILSGTHRLVLESGEFVLGAGNLTLLRPNEIHIRSIDEPGQYIMLVFPAVEIYKLSRYLGDSYPMDVLWQSNPPTMMLSPTNTEHIRHGIERINLFCSTNSEMARAELRTFLADLMVHYFGNTIEDSLVRAPWLSKLLWEMRSPENARRGLDALLEMAPYSHEYVCREFKRVLGCTPTRYINNVRLDHAQKLLENPVMDIVDISYAVGFDSISYFYRLFKNRFGITPSQFKKRHQISQPDLPREQRAEALARWD